MDCSGIPLKTSSQEEHARLSTKLFDRCCAPASQALCLRGRGRAKLKELCTQPGLLFLTACLQQGIDKEKETDKPEEQYLLKRLAEKIAEVFAAERDSQYEARISRLEGEAQAFRESGQSQPAAKKMPRQPDGPPPKKAKAAAKAEAKAVSQPKIIVVKTKAATPAARRAEPSS